MSNQHEGLLITKANGERERFDVRKLEHSLRKSGANDEEVSTVTSALTDTLTEGVTTRDIYRKAYALLRKGNRSASVSYSLRRALLELGPTGYPFEDFVAEIFKAKGYTTHTRTQLHGICTTHEVDLVGEKEGSRFAGELKFHNDVGIRSDLKVVLYVKARFDDVRGYAQKKETDVLERIDSAWLITNTKFSAQALEYATCAGLNLIGWGYPEKGNLQDLIEETNVQPLTCLRSLQTAQKRALMERDVVLCKTLKEHPELLSDLGLSPRAIHSVLAEIETVHIA